MLQQYYSVMHLWIGDVKFRTLVFTIEKLSNVIQSSTHQLYKTTSMLVPLPFCSKLIDMYSDIVFRKKRHPNFSPGPDCVCFYTDKFKFKICIVFADSSPKKVVIIWQRKLNLKLNYQLTIYGPCIYMYMYIYDIIYNMHIYSKPVSLF